MPARFVIEDELHSEICGEFPSLETALAELKRFASIPWDEEPNVAPCTNWRECGRDYEIIEYEGSPGSWLQVKRVPALEISSKGTKWADAFSGKKPP